jgi:hypothetical protein
MGPFKNYLYLKIILNLTLNIFRDLLAFARMPITNVQFILLTAHHKIVDAIPDEGHT